MTRSNSWRELMSDGNGLKVAVFAGGVGLQAMEAFIGSTLLPSVVGDIGGLELFAWNTTVFIVASIIAAMFAAVRPFGVGPRGSYYLAALGFGAGSLIAGLAPSMEVMLLGRAVQGFGAGLLTAMSYAMIRLVFPEHLWGRAFAVISSVWGVSTLIGPAIGGIFAEFDAWRWAFFMLVPAAFLLGLGASRVVPKTSDEQGMTRFPIPQILLMVSAVLALSVASIVTDSTPVAVTLVGVAVVAIVLLAVRDQRSAVRLFPSGTFTWGSTLAPLFAAMMLVNAAIISDIFIPYFLQNLHGLGPLLAGYMVALVALGWSSGSVTVASWTGDRARAALMSGPFLQLAGALGLAVFVAHDNTAGALLPLIPIGASLLLLGLGIGVSWPHISTRLLHAAPAGERDLTSASISMVQLLAAGLGAAIAGVIANAGGLAGGTGTASTTSAATWLYGAFVVIPLVAIPIVRAVVRTMPASRDLIEVPAE